MKFKHILKALAVPTAMMVGATAFGSAAAEDLHNQMMKVGDQITSCANFTGTWKGVCETKNLLDPNAAVEKMEQTMTFKQIACSGLKNEDFGLVHIGATTAKSVASERGVITARSKSSWKEDGQKLKTVEDVSLSLYGAEGVVRKAMMEGSFKREGDAIVGTITNKIKGKSAGTEETVLAHEESACRLELQPAIMTHD